MEKKEPISSNPKGVCEKLFDAVTVSPGFRQFRRISYRSQDPVPPPAAPHKPPAALAPSSVDASHVPAKADTQPVVPLSFAPTLKEQPLAPTPASDQAPVKPKKKLSNDSPMKTAVRKGKVSGRVHQLQGKKEEAKKPAKVKAPQVAPGTKSEGEKKGGLANINEKANDYIARARMKIRHTPTIAGGDSNARATSSNGRPLLKVTSEYGLNHELLMSTV